MFEMYYLLLNNHHAIIYFYYDINTRNVLRKNKRVNNFVVKKKKFVNFKNDIIRTRTNIKFR